MDISNTINRLIEQNRYEANYYSQTAREQCDAETFDILMMFLQSNRSNLNSKILSILLKLKKDYNLILVDSDHKVYESLSDDEFSSVIKDCFKGLWGTRKAVTIILPESDGMIIIDGNGTGFSVFNPDSRLYIFMKVYCRDESLYFYQFNGE